MNYQMCHVTTTFGGSKPKTVRNQQTAFEKYAAFQTRKDTINTSDDFKNMFALTPQLTLQDMARAHHEYHTRHADMEIKSWKGAILGNIP